MLDDLLEKARALDPITITVEVEGTEHIPEWLPYSVHDETTIDHTGKYMGLEDNPSETGDVLILGRRPQFLEIDLETLSVYLKDIVDHETTYIGDVTLVVLGDEPARVLQEEDPDYDPQDGSVDADTYVGTYGAGGPSLE